MSDNRTKVLDEKRHVSVKISDLVRYIAFGLVAVTYALFTSSSAFSIELLNQHKNILLWASFLGALTILIDYLQFLSGYISVNQALKNKDGDYKYDDSSFFYNLRGWLFYIKQLTVAGGLILFCYVMVKSTT